MNFQAIWEKHRRFLLQVAGGLAVFMVLLQVARGYSDVETDLRGNTVTASSLGDRVKKLNMRYGDTVSKFQVLNTQLDNLRTKIAVGPRAEKDPTDRHPIEFKKRKGSVYEKFRDSANRIGLRFPDNEPNFDEGSDLSDEEWGQRYRQLEVLEDVLAACVAQRVRVIAEIRPMAVDFEDVPSTGARKKKPGPRGKSTKKKDGNLMITRYPVQLEVHATYDAFLGLIATFQKDDAYIAVELESLASDAKLEPGVLKGIVNFVGVDLLEPPAETKGKGRNRPRRRSGGWRK